MIYGKALLKELLGKYDRRRVLSDKKLSVKIEKSSLSEKYWGEESYKYREDIEEDVRAFVKKGWISADWDKSSDVLIRVSMVLDKVEEIRAFLGCINPQEIINEERRYIMDKLYACDSESVEYRYLQGMLNLIENRKPHQTYYKDIEDLKINRAVVAAIEKIDDEVLLRNFSKKQFGDSKLLEKKASIIMKIFREFNGEEYADFTDFCKAHRIEKNAGYAYMKNGITFKINQQEIDLDKLNVEISLSNDAIQALEIVSISKKKVITIENLTTFYYYNDDEAIILYLGGFHNQTKRLLIEKIHKFAPDLEWFHMGDIDWGGFQIFFDLCKKTGIHFKPFHMGIEELQKYKEECLCLTDYDKKNLKKMLQENIDNPFAETIQYMLANGYKLEQESLIFEN